MTGKAVTALRSLEVSVASGFAITNKSAALDRYRSRYVRFGAVYCTNLARSPSRFSPCPQIGRQARADRGSANPHAEPPCVHEGRDGANGRAPDGFSSV